MRKRVKGRTLVTLPGLRRARDERGWSQEELARRAGVSRINVARIETGQYATLQTLGKLMDALDVDIDVLTNEPPEVELAKLDDDLEGIEAQYVSRFAMGDEHADPLFEVDVAEEKLREFRAAGGTDKAFLSIATELLRLGKARARYLAETE